MVEASYVAVVVAGYDTMAEVTAGHAWVQGTLAAAVAAAVMHTSAAGEPAGTACLLYAFVTRFRMRLVLSARSSVRLIGGRG
jgi:hypothetical protein